MAGFAVSKGFTAAISARSSLRVALMLEFSKTMQ